jgi:hypothetical protein
VIDEEQNGGRTNGATLAPLTWEFRNTLGHRLLVFL